MARKVLIIDDDPAISSLLAQVLKDKQIETIIADNGQEGLKLARKQRPDLIILDVTMPKLDGYHVARMLKFDTHFQKIPIIMQTAKASVEEKSIGKEVGVDAYIAKPYQVEEMLEVIEQQLNNLGEAQEEVNA